MLVDVGVVVPGGNREPVGKLLPFTEAVGPPKIPVGAEKETLAEVSNGKTGLSIANTAGDRLAKPTDGPGEYRKALLEKSDSVSHT